MEASSDRWEPPRPHRSSSAPSPSPSITLYAQPPATVSRPPHPSDDAPSISRQATEGYETANEELPPPPPSSDSLSAYAERDETTYESEGRQVVDDSFRFIHGNSSDDYGSLHSRYYQIRRSTDVSLTILFPEYHPDSHLVLHCSDSRSDSIAGSGE